MRLLGVHHCLVDYPGMAHSRLCMLHHWRMGLPHCRRNRRTHCGGSWLGHLARSLVMTYTDAYDPDLHGAPEQLPPAAQRYMAVWITLAVVALPLISWWLVK
jgi:hypothetical protein